MKIAYFGFDLFYDCLYSLVKNGHEIVKIFTCDVDEIYESNKKTYSLAKEHGIQITSEKVTIQMILNLEASGCELMVSAGYYFKIPVSTLIPAINIHPSLLPDGRGPWPLPFIILKQRKITGITIHKLSDKLDEGDIVLQAQINVSDDENLETLTQKSKQTAVRLIEKFITNPYEFLNSSKPQNHGEYWNEPDVKSMTFTLLDEYQKIDLITRAFYGYKCYLKLHDRVVEIKKAKCIPESDRNINFDKNLIKINDGYLCILK